LSGALDGLRVVDLTSHVSGPYCTMLLGDLGADVIKVEKPGAGDDARRMPPFVEGQGAPFMLINRNKRSITLDLKDPADLATFRALARDADVVIENFKPGTLDRMGLGYADLSADNPGLVYCSISGFGQTGPLKELGGFDLMIQAMSGLMSVAGDPDGPPHRLPIPISDIGAGMFACIGILAALGARHTTGKGQQVDASLFEAGMAFGIYEAAGLFATGRAPERLGQGHRGAVPYQVFRTADGWLTVGGATQALWVKLCRLIGCPELVEDPRFADNGARVRHRADLVPLLQERLGQRTTEAWVAAFDAEGIPNGPVWTYDQVLTHPHTLAREMVVPVEHPVAGATRTLGTPVKLTGTPTTIRRPAPVLGQHGEEIRRELAARSGR
jgi:crotonobetainyl-CoA:carnitine CoA-transferase CaiB-like acyl-CoA transferase